MVKISPQGSNWVLLNLDGTPATVPNGATPPTFTTEAAARQWASANAVELQGNQVDQYPRSDRPVNFGGPFQRHGPRPIAPTVQPNGRWAFLDGAGNVVQGAPDHASEADARAWATSNPNLVGGGRFGGPFTDQPNVPHDRGSPVQVGDRWHHKDQAGNRIDGPDFATEAEARSWDQANPYFGGLTEDEARRIDDINARLGELEGEHRDASDHLADRVAKSVDVAAANVNRLQVERDALLAERARLLPAPAPTSFDVDKAAALLRRGNWIDNGNGTWTNTVPFQIRVTAGGENIHVPAGVQRPLDQAADIEAQRPR